MKRYGYLTHVVKYGDSIQKIAYDYGVEDWREIIYFNNLTYPYILSEEYSTGEVRGVARIGDTLYLPSYDYRVAPTATEEIGDKEMIEKAYGIDLDIYTATDDNGRAKNLETKGQLLNSDHDLLLARGIDNLVQQLTIKLSTRKGSLLLHPKWGCNLIDYCGTKGTRENLIDMELVVREALLEDFRVVEVNNLSVEKKDDTAVIRCDILPISPYPEFEFTTEVSRERG